MTKLEARRARMIPAPENPSLLYDPEPEKFFGPDARWYGPQHPNAYDRAPNKGDEERRAAAREAARAAAESEEGGRQREVISSPYADKEIVVPADLMTENVDAKVLRDAARKFTAEALITVVNVMRKSVDPKVQMAAAEMVMNRALGKPVAPVGALSEEETREMLGTIVLPAKETEGTVVVEGLERGAPGLGETVTPAQRLAGG